MSNNELTILLEGIESNELDVFNDRYDFVTNADLDESEHYELGEGEYNER